MLGYILYAFGNIKNGVFYCWVFELIETRHKSISCSVVNALDSCTMIVFGLYVLFISKNWIYLELFFYSLGILAYIVILFFMPESPKWNLIHGRNHAAHKELNYIATVNKVPFSIPSDAIFIESVLVGHKPENNINTNIINSASRHSSASRQRSDNRLTEFINRKKSMI